MSSPREPGDLSLEGLGDRDGLRPPPSSPPALVAQTVAPESIRDFQTAYAALIDAVFTAPGATEWLASLRRVVTALLAGKNPPQPDAIRPAESEQLFKSF